MERIFVVEGKDPPRKERSFEEAQEGDGGLSACGSISQVLEQNVKTWAYEGSGAFLHNGVSREIFRLLVPTASPPANITAMKGEEKGKSVE